MIKKISSYEIGLAAEVIRRSFSTVARDLGITEQNCPTHTSFMKTEDLHNRFNYGEIMFGYYYNDVLTGFVSLRKDDGTIYKLENLAVMPESRHNGNGKALLEHCILAVKNLGGTVIKIGIIEEHTVLKDWYIQNGFVHTGTKKYAHLPFTVGEMEYEV